MKSIAKTASKVKTKERKLHLVHPKVDSSPFKKRIIWAIDAFDPNRRQLQKTAHFLKALCRDHEICVEPVYVIAMSDRSIEAAVGRDQWVKQAQEIASRSIKSLVTHARLTPYVCDPTVIECKSILKDGVDVVANHAKDVGAQLIVTNTRVQKGIDRLLSRTFAEVLFLHSEIPVLAVSPRARKISKFDEVFYATDLSTDSRESFRQVVEFAKIEKSKITLFHAIRNSMYPVIGSAATYIPGVPVPMDDVYFNQYKVTIEKQLAQWCQWASRRGVICESFVELQKVNISNQIVAGIQKRRFGFGPIGKHHARNLAHCKLSRMD